MLLVGTFTRREGYCSACDVEHALRETMSDESLAGSSARTRELEVYPARRSLRADLRFETVRCGCVDTDCGSGGRRMCVSPRHSARSILRSLIGRGHLIHRGARCRARGPDGTPVCVRRLYSRIHIEGAMYKPCRIYEVSESAGSSPARSILLAIVDFSTVP